MQTDIGLPWDGCPAEAIREAIELHAFDREKARLTSAGNLKDAGLLRKGRAGEWHEPES